MLLGALVDCGLAIDQLQADLDRLDIGGLSVSAEPTKRCGLAGTKVHVHAAEHHHHRSLSTIKRMISASGVGEPAKRDSLRVFQRLGEVEARAHRIPLERVHFHEVGALDSIADIVGACCGLHRLGIERVLCSALNLGSGTVQAAHGTMPVPAPATARLVEGIPTYAQGPAVELTTPTGAALAVTLAERFGPVPSMRIERSGYGAGSRQLDGLPNLLRILVGESAEADTPAESIWALEADIDDMTPEMAGFAMERLLASGALDVTLIPVQMKKNRPGFRLSVLARPEDRARLGDLMLAETSTLGIRETAARRRLLPRSWEQVETPYGTVRVKVTERHAAGPSCAPEYEDCRKLARDNGVPFQHVWDLARRAYLRTAG